MYGEVSRAGTAGRRERQAGQDRLLHFIGRAGPSPKTDMKPPPRTC
jgi:hypothetical protein